MQKLLKDQVLFLTLNICFKGKVVVNHETSNYMASNSNSYESLVRNLINPFRREGLLYLIALTLFFCVLSITVLYFTHFFHHSLKIRGTTFYL